MRKWMLIVAMLCSANAWAGTPLPEGPHIVVDGLGEISAKPDQVRIAMTFEQRAPQPLLAKETVDKAVARYLQVLADFNVDAESITASDLSASENFEYNGGKRVSKGFSAERNVTAVLTRLDRLDALLDAGLRAGANGIGEVTFESSCAAEFRAEAKRKAVADARSKAEESAAAFGARLGAVYSIDSLTSRYANAWSGGTTLDSLQVSGSRARDIYLQANVEYSETVSAVFDLQR